MLNDSLFGIRKKKVHTEELQLTAMIDMLLIILIFLIKSTEVSDVALDIPKEIALPSSRYDNAAKQKEMIYVFKNKVTYNSKDLAIVQEIEPGYFKIPVDYLGDGGTVITALYDELFAKRDVLVRAGEAGGAENFEGIINIVADRNVSYSVLRQVMATAAKAQFNKYNLVIVKERDQN